MGGPQAMMGGPQAMMGMMVLFAFESESPTTFSCSTAIISPTATLPPPLTRAALQCVAVFFLSPWLGFDRAQGGMMAGMGQQMPQRSPPGGAPPRGGFGGGFGGFGGM